MSLSKPALRDEADVDNWRKNRCRGCGALESFDSAVDLGDQVVSGFFRPDEKQNPRVPLHLVVCRHCGLAQLEHSTPPEILYSHFWYRSAITQTMRDHLSGIVDQAMNEGNVIVGDSVLDIGANDGTMLGFYPRNVHRVAVEPAQNLRAECLTHSSIVISDLFPTKQLGGERFQVITAIAMFYDVEDPAAFLQEITRRLSATGVFIVQMNYLDTMVRDCAFDNIGHEHLTYFNMTTLAPMLRSAGLFAYKVELNSLNGGSFRVFCRKASSETVAKDVRGYDGSVEKLLIEETRSQAGSLDSLRGMQARIEKIRLVVMNYLRGKSHNWVCGASTRGNTLLQYFGLTGEYFVAAGERDPHKFGLVTPGTNIPIREETIMREIGKVLLVLPWAFRTEIISRERAFLEKGGEMLFPMPEPVVVTKDGVKKLL